MTHSARSHTPHHARSHVARPPAAFSTPFRSSLRSPFRPPFTPPLAQHAPQSVQGNLAHLGPLEQGLEAFANRLGDFVQFQRVVPILVPLPEGVQHPRSRATFARGHAAPHRPTHGGPEFLKAQLLFARLFKNLPSVLANPFGQFFKSDLAIPVAVEIAHERSRLKVPPASRTGVGPTLTWPDCRRGSGGLSGWSRRLAGRLHRRLTSLLRGGWLLAGLRWFVLRLGAGRHQELGPRQHPIPILVAPTQHLFERRFVFVPHFVSGELAVPILVELGKQLVGGLANQHRFIGRADERRRAEQQNAPQDRGERRVHRHGNSRVGWNVRQPMDCQPAH